MSFSLRDVSAWYRLEILAGNILKLLLLVRQDVLDLLLAKPGVVSPHESFFYYVGNRLDAVRSGRWKLKMATPLSEEYPKINGGNIRLPRALFDLETDPAEQKSVLADHPDVVARLQTMIDAAREDLGDSAQKMIGKNNRPVGQVKNVSTTAPAEEPQD